MPSSLYGDFVLTQGDCVLAGHGYVFISLSTAVQERMTFTLEGQALIQAQCLSFILALKLHVAA